MPAPLRLGLIEEIATLPLVYPILAGWCDIEGFNLSRIPVSAEQAVELLDNNKLDVALIPVVDYPLRARNLTLVPIGLTSEKRGPATLVGLKRIDELDGERIAVEDRANPALPLLKVLLKRYYSIELHFRAEYIPWQELPAQEQREDDDWEKMRLTLLLGDEAVAASHSPMPDEKMAAEDLSKNWWIMTGTSFTWYIMAVRRQFAEAHPDLGPALIRLALDAIRKGKEQHPSLVLEGQKRAQAVGLTLNAEQLEAFWSEQTYGIVQKQQESLMTFFQWASQLRLVPLPASLNLIG